MIAFWRWLREWRWRQRVQGWTDSALEADYKQHDPNGPVVSNLREVDGVPHVDLSDGTTIKSVDGGKTWTKA